MLGRKERVCNLILTPYSSDSTTPSFKALRCSLNDTLDNIPVAYTLPAASEEAVDTAPVEVEQDSLNTGSEAGQPYKSDMVRQSMEGVEYHIHHTAQRVAVAAAAEEGQQQQKQKLQQQGRTVGIQFLGVVRWIAGWHNRVHLQAIGGAEVVVDAQRIMDWVPRPEAVSVSCRVWRSADERHQRHSSR